VVTAKDRNIPANTEVADLRSLADRLGAAPAPADREVEQALERGFGRLIALEASLQRMQGTLARSTAEREGREGELNSLRNKIEMLREALTEVRRLYPADRSPAMPPGFVLPLDR
jgi:chromosome segregation ATPase